MSNNQFLKILQEKGIIDETAKRRLEREVVVSEKPVDRLIYEKNLADGSEVAKAKAESLGVPYQEVDVSSLTKEILGLVPEDTARTYSVVPLELTDKSFVAGMLNPDDPKAQEALKFIARKNKTNLGIYAISYGDWQSVIQKYSPYKSRVDEAVKSLGLKNDSERARELEEGESGGEEAPVIRIVADTIKEAVKVEASDIHIEPQENYLRIRIRVGGDLQEAAQLPIELSHAVVARVKVMSNLRIDETRIPQDGRFRRKVFDRNIDFRVATFPTPLGEKVAIRVLDPKTGLKTLDQLGLSGRNIERVKAGIQRPFGMIIISGPTGSGKTTTLYAMLQFLNNDSVNIVSLEDPVEYFVGGVNQSQVRPEINYDFASGLRQILRQDPDIIMVGEIRDEETASLAIHAALTGHVVLSTLHTNNAFGVIPRFIDMGVKPFLLPTTLNLMLAQRLVSMLCPDCREEETPPEAVQEIISEGIKGMPAELTQKYQPPFKVYRSGGCDKCGGKGTKGRIAVYEVLEMTRELGEVINDGASGEKVSQEAKNQGMVTMRQDGILKALQGLVPIEAVLRETTE